MIVDPDFLDHWRTRMVADALQDEAAPLYILRLWGHCQERKSDTFTMPVRGLKAQCRFPGDAEQFEAALIEAGFISRDGETVTVIGWAEKNASLLAAWENGQKGGRPRKNGQSETHGKPTGNPGLTQREPIANPDETDKRREDKRREETPHTPHRSGDVVEPEGFKAFWASWPKNDRKQAKGKCFEAWRRGRFEGVSAEILDHIDHMKRTEAWQKQGGQFIPAPLVYLNGRRWEGAELALTSSLQLVVGGV